MDDAAKAERHREMAEEYRTMAECATEDRLQVQYRKLAEAYDDLAGHEVRAARNLKIAN